MRCWRWLAWRSWPDSRATGRCAVPRAASRRMVFYVVVPFYNEAAGMRATLDALAAQSDREFTLILVDNASTDRGGDVAREFARQHLEMAIEVIFEPAKGTGAASDT